MYKKEFLEKQEALNEKLAELQQEHLALMAEKVEEDPVEEAPVEEAAPPSEPAPASSPFQFGS